MLLAWLGLALAEPAAPSAAAGFTPRALVGHAVFDLRGGASSGPTGPGAMICAEVAPHPNVAIEACGTGGGFLYPEVGDEMMHVRAEASVPLARRGRGELWFQPGLGMAELQRGEDEPGFRFGPARASNQRDGAGLEASLSVKGRWWVGDWAYLVGEVSTGAAWIEAAPVILEQESTVVPFVTATAGFGF